MSTLFQVFLFSLSILLYAVEYYFLFINGFAAPFCLYFSGMRLPIKLRKFSFVDTSPKCSLIIEGEPLYLDDLRQGNNPPIAYVCGKRTGVMYEYI